jgi:hypothetical protein
MGGRAARRQRNAWMSGIYAVDVSLDRGGPAGAS